MASEAPPPPLPAVEIRKLTSTAPAGNAGPPVEAPSDRPTYANMVAAFKALASDPAVAAPVPPADRLIVAEEP